MRGVIEIRMASTMVAAACLSEKYLILNCELVRIFLTGKLRDFVSLPCDTIVHSYHTHTRRPVKKMVISRSSVAHAGNRKLLK